MTVRHGAVGRRFCLSAACLVGLTLLVCPIAARAQPGPQAFRIVEPVVDPEGRPLYQSGPDGEEYPLFRPAAPDDPIARQAASILEKTFCAQAIRLYDCTRAYLRHEGRASGQAEAVGGLDLDQPIHLNLSKRQGGFGKIGFFLKDGDGPAAFVNAGYVDLVVDSRSVEEGRLEEIFPHELGNVITGYLLGVGLRHDSTKMHMSMVVTDYSMAFWEGYGEHFQPLARDRTENPHLLSLMKGDTGLDLRNAWHSAYDRELRTHGVKRNLFIYDKVPPSGWDGPDPDLYALFLDDATSSLFCTDRVMTGQQMMASEGVVSTLFYRIVNSRELGEKYRPAEFYRPFCPSGAADIDPERDFSPYENVNLKLIAVMRDRLRARLTEWERSGMWGPVMPELIRAYGEVYPEEKREIYRLFLYTTRFATVSNSLRKLFGRFNRAGRIGDRNESKAIASRLQTEGKETFEKILAGELPLGDNIGPEIWLLNSQFKIARAVWSGKRDTSLAINLNTAGPVELMTIPGVTPDVARALTDWRDSNGFFRSLEDIKRVDGVPDSIHQAMASMEKASPK